MVISCVPEVIDPTPAVLPQPVAPAPGLVAAWFAGRAGWAAQIGKRLQRLLWLKAFGITLWIWVFMIGYFHTLRHPSQPPFIMPLTPLDLLVPFQPGAFMIYASLWVYVGIPPGLLLGFRDLLAYGAWVGALCLSGLALFYFSPTAVPGFALDPVLVNDPAIALLQGLDAAGNACPSMHVASAVFAAVWLHHLLRGIGAPRLLEACNATWLALIVYSTLAVRQHVVLDVIAGAVLGSLFAWASLRWRPRARVSGYHSGP